MKQDELSTYLGIPVDKDLWFRWNGYKATVDARDQFRAELCASVGKAVPTESSGPGLFRKGINLAKATFQHVAAGLPKCSEQQMAARLEICKRCELYNHAAQMCSQCGCNTSPDAFVSKTSWKDQVCPHPRGNKWAEIDRGFL